MSDINKKRVDNFISRSARNRRYRRRIIALLCILSVCVFISVFWQLRETGTALMEDEAGEAVLARLAENEKRVEEASGNKEGDDISDDEDTLSPSEAEYNYESQDDDASLAGQATETEKNDVNMQNGFDEQASRAETVETYNEKNDTEVIRYLAESESGVKVKVEAAEDAFTEEVTLTVSDVANDKAFELVEEGLQSVEDGDRKEVVDAIALDICFINSNGKELEPDPDKYLMVAIELPESTEINEENLCLLHVVDEETIEEIAQVQLEDNELSFEAQAFSIYVVTALGEREKDRIHEWNSFFPGQPHDAEGYTHNEESQPYILMPGESVIISVYLTDEEHANLGYEPGKLRFWSEMVKPSAPNTSDYLTRDYLPEVAITESELPEFMPDSEKANGYKWKCSAKYTAIKEGEIVVYWGDGDKSHCDSGSKFYIEVPSGTEDEKYTKYDHADIEIADGGSYYKTTIVKDSSGNEIRTTINYNSYVTKVIKCYVYDKEKQILCELDTDKYWDFSGEGTQVEFTSKNRSPDFSRTETDSAKFIVDLKCEPITKSVEKYKDGVLVEKLPTEDIKGNSSYTSFEKPNMEYELGHQSVIDAANKCPDHSGLDFNVRYNDGESKEIEPVKAKFEATKKLNGGELRNEAFEFELYDSSNNLIKTARNDALGKVVFDELEYITAGTYTYTIKEKKPLTPDSYKYDEHIAKVTVSVSGDVYGALSTPVVTYSDVDSEKNEFVNEVSYKLPDTGGGGTYPYTFGGLSVLLMALILAREKKAKRLWIIEQSKKP